MPPPLASYDLKIKRAKSHIDELEREIQAYFASNPYTVIVESDPRSGERCWRVQVNKDVPDQWSCIVGDAIHNARASLDLLMVAVVRHCDPNRVSYNHVKFIVGEDRIKFEARLADALKGASARAIKIIKRLKPYKGGNEAFWNLHQLDILDKHKAIIPVSASTVSFGMDITSPFRNHPALADQWAGQPRELIFFKPKDRPSWVPIYDGAVLFKVGAGVQHIRDDDIQFSAEVAFAQGQILDGEPMVPALHQLVDFTERAIKIVEKHVLRA